MPELRKNPLLGQWVAVASERVPRLDHFLLPPRAPLAGPCRYCPGHERELPAALLTYGAPHGSDEAAWDLRVVPSKFPLLRIEGDVRRRVHGVYDVMQGIGAHEVIIPTPEHGVDFGGLPAAAVERAITAWIDRIVDLQRDTRLRSFVITHTRGADGDLGHACTQLLATPVVPQTLHVEWLQARAYHDYRDRCLACDLLAQEAADGARILIATHHLLAFCPFASSQPFEMWIMPRRHVARLPSITDVERTELATIIQTLCSQIDQTLGAPPYRLSLHQAPSGEDHNPACHWRIEIVPRLDTAPARALHGGLPFNRLAPEDAVAMLRART